jgi:hypothetical protein
LEEWLSSLLLYAASIKSANVVDQGALVLEMAAREYINASEAAVDAL